MDHQKQKKIRGDENKNNGRKITKNVLLNKYIMFEVEPLKIFCVCGVINALSGTGRLNRCCFCCYTAMMEGDEQEK